MRSRSRYLASPQHLYRVIEDIPGWLDGEMKRSQEGIEATRQVVMTLFPLEVIKVLRTGIDKSKNDGPG